jgi:hypothetical protein
MSNRLRLNGDTVSCPDPELGTWAPMAPPAVSVTGRLVYQGGYRVTLTWEVMSDGDFSGLMDAWMASGASGFRITSARVPPYRSDDNADWDDVTGVTGGYITFQEPTCQAREVLQATGITVILEGIARP